MKICAYCACGCKQTFEKFDSRGRSRQFIRGHQLKQRKVDFAKGHEPWNKNVKGIHLSPSTEFKKGIVPWNKGMEGFAGGERNGMWGKSGPLSPVWKNGATNRGDVIRATRKYAKWRMKVFMRDKFTCTVCGVKGAYLNADHIKPFALFPELRFDVSNGRTLCEPCHKATPTYGNRKEIYGQARS